MLGTSLAPVPGMPRIHLPRTPMISRHLTMVFLCPILHPTKVNGETL